jgi:transcriptional regulator with GAF, ATPase, and Fis domain
MAAAGEIHVIAKSAAMSALVREIDQVAGSDARVMIQGESGSGKELVANAIHAKSDRARKAFLAVNCAGLTETLLESELFGHVKGSFTGAYRDKPGKLELAHGGTIFLDEVGEMTPRMQALMLRFLALGEIQKVGADRPIATVNVRVVAATNRDLATMVARGDFREDLYYRLKVIELIVPPLRERRSDILPLAEHFVQRFRQRDGRLPKSINPDASAILLNYGWPGNVRELENVMERTVVTARGESITADDLPLDIRRAGGSARPRIERRRTVADELYERITKEGKSFWSVVYPLYIQRDITRATVRDLVRRGLEASRGSYRIVAELFNMDETDYRRFLNFLRKHDCQVPFKDYRVAPSARRAPAEPRPIAEHSQPLCV